jgi:hypothetical protein
MFKRAFLLAFSLCLEPVTSAFAEDVQFICHSEASANAIAAVVVKAHKRADEVTRERLMLGKCWFLDKKASVFVVHRGATFGAAFKVTVVGLSQKMADLPVMWSLVPTNELHGDGTI